MVEIVRMAVETRYRRGSRWRLYVMAQCQDDGKNKMVECVKMAVERRWRRGSRWRLCQGDI